MKSFKLYLYKQSPMDAIEHMQDCLVNGDPDGVAWNLMEQYLGPDWKVDPDRLPETVSLVLQLMAKDLADEEKLK